VQIDQGSSFVLQQGIPEMRSVAGHGDVIVVAGGVAGVIIAAGKRLGRSALKISTSQGGAETGVGGVALSLGGGGHAVRLCDAGEGGVVASLGHARTFRLCESRGVVPRARLLSSSGGSSRGVGDGA